MCLSVCLLNPQRREGENGSREIEKSKSRSANREEKLSFLSNDPALLILIMIFLSLSLSSSQALGENGDSSRLGDLEWRREGRGNAILLIEILSPPYTHSPILSLSLYRPCECAMTASPKFPSAARGREREREREREQTAACSVCKSVYITHSHTLAYMLIKK